MPQYLIEMEMKIQTGAKYLQTIAFASAVCVKFPFQMIVVYNLNKTIKDEHP